MISIRDYQESDAEPVGRLIADTFSECNLCYMPIDERGPFLGPFQFAYSTDSQHQHAIVEIIRAPMVFVAENDGDIVGVLRGRNERLHSLFVRQDMHRQGIGRSLMQRLEAECITQGGHKITMMATLYAVPFYQAIGYKKTTGVRKMKCFDGEGLPYQSMKKVFMSL